MRGRPWLTASLAVAAASARTADADENYSLHVIGSAQVSWTDNLFAVPDDAADPLPPHEGDTQLQLRPGVLGTYETPRTIHNLEYDLDANLYVAHDEARSLGHTATWRSFFLTSPRSEVQTSVIYARGALATLATRSPAAGGQPQPTASGDGTFWSLDAGETAHYSLTPELRLSQGLGARTFTNQLATGDAGGYQLGGSLGGDRGWKHSAVAVTAQTAYVVLDQGVATARTQNSSLVVSYRRDFTPRWNAVADAGATWIASLDDAPSTIQPTAGVLVGYLPNWGNAGLQLRRTMTPNLYIAENTINDLASINATLPLPWLRGDAPAPRLTLAGAAGVARSRVIEGDTTTSSIDIVNADVALTYAPRGDLALSLRAQHLRQLPGDSSGAAAPAYAYDRTTVVLSAVWRFPERLAAEIPSRDSLRVDRSDDTPVGEEVAPTPAPGSAP